MKRIFLVCISLLSAAAVLTVSSAAADEAGAPVLLVLGDSLSAGYGLPAGTGWVWLLQERLARSGAGSGAGWRVVNASISGDTTAGGLSRLPALLERHHPQVLVLELGANDGLRGLPPGSIRENLAALVRLGQSHDCQVLLLGVRLPPNYGAAYTGAFQAAFVEVAKARQVALVPELLAGVAEERELMQADGLHPTQSAQARILDNVWPALPPLLDSGAAD